MESEIAITEKVVKKVSEKRCHMSRNLKEVYEQAMWLSKGRIFQAVGIASAITKDKWQIKY